MRIIVAIIGCLILLPIAAFCVFGFMATFEPTDRTIEFMAFRVGYAVISVGCLAGGVALTVRCLRRKMKTEEQ